MFNQNKGCKFLKEIKAQGLKVNSELQEVLLLNPIVTEYSKEEMGGVIARTGRDDKRYFTYYIPNSSVSGYFII